mmetsp:Transcript_12255/g.19416  ORF Transcript_12255/g.19416 Transcript_12255/m.19416 type:complete len:225 (-) Transcript_12255:8-682(-)
MPPKGISLEKISFNITPNAYTSLGSEHASPRKSSGAMYEGVPAAALVVDASDNLTASPKSHSFATIPVSSTKTFCDLMSRCMMGGDAVCKNAKPAMAPAASLSRCSLGTSDRRCTTSNNEPPWHHSKTMRRLVPRKQAPNNRTTFGCRSSLRMSTSRLKSSLSSGSIAERGSTGRFTATSHPLHTPLYNTPRPPWAFLSASSSMSRTSISTTPDRALSCTPSPL